ncbi:MAG: hypothetical protein M0C28_45565 [Candidatus Moduliflexus flocculans]|nr:hypothetical protein [Candidatus Moduliflexus flocculans]
MILSPGGQGRRPPLGRTEMRGPEIQGDLLRRRRHPLRLSPGRAGGSRWPAAANSVFASPAEAFLDAYRRHNHDVWRAFERGETDQATAARRALPPCGRRARPGRAAARAGSAPSTSRRWPASPCCCPGPW